MKMLLTFLVLIFISDFIHASTAGPNVGATATSVNFGVLQDPWTTNGDITNAQQNDGTFGTCPVDKNDNGSEYLQLVNFGFAVPAGATINGIEIDWKIKGSGGGFAGLIEGSARIVKGGSISTTDLRGTATPSYPSGGWPTSATLEVYGGASTLWGETFTSSDINASNFGAVLTCDGTSDAQNGTASVDYVQITVTYTGGVSNPASGPITMTRSSTGGGPITITHGTGSGSIVIQK